MNIDIESCIGCHCEPSTDPTLSAVRCVNEACEMRPEVRAATLLLAIHLWNALWNNDDA